MLGYNLSPGPNLAGWMKDAGVENLQEEVLEVLVGAAAKDKETGQKPIEVMLAALEGVEVNLGRESLFEVLSEIKFTYFYLEIPGYFFSAADVKKLKSDLRQELEVNGSSYRTHVVWGQRIDWLIYKAVFQVSNSSS